MIIITTSFIECCITLPAVLCPQGQDLIGVLTLKSEQKKVTANMVTLNFGTFSKITVQDELVSIPKVRLDVINSMAE